METTAKAAENHAAIVLQNLTFTYPEREQLVLRDVSLTVNTGEFVVLCGPSGCGKTTLLRQLKPTLALHGRLSGEILFEGKPLRKLSQRDAASKIGFVLQSPENQIVTDKVWHELAFELESPGFDTPAIRLRVAEMASFFGIQTWFCKNVTELSGGQKQLLALASVIALQPSLLILDEPTSQLDPIAAADFLATVGIGVLCVSGLAFVLTVIFIILNWQGFSGFISGGSEAVNAVSDPAAVWKYTGLMLAFACEVLAAAVALSWGRGNPEWTVQVAPSNRKLSKRSIAAAAMILLAIPLTIYVGIYFFGDRKYYFISLLIILESMLPFALIFESRKPQARELVNIAVLCAIGVAGRVAFFILPQFKPVVAVVIIAGVAFGGEAGFLVGAVTGFVSNMFFGQGPLTPWQMFAFGIIGFLAGILFQKGLLLRSRTALCIYGGLTTFLIYGGIMNPASMLTSQPNLTWEMLWPYYLQGIPFDLVHALATVVFLYIAAEPMLEKLDRIKVKYGLVE